MNRTVLTILVIVSVPLFLMVNVWQSFRFSRVLDEMDSIRKETAAWVESNNRLEAGIAAYSNPGRLDTLATEELGLEKKTEAPDVIIYFPEDEGGLNE